MPTKRDSIKARASALIKRFTDPDQPDLLSLMSVYIPDESFSIDDGVDYGDPMKSTKPDFIQKELDGWQ